MNFSSTIETKLRWGFSKQRLNMEMSRMLHKWDDFILLGIIIIALVFYTYSIINIILDKYHKEYFVIAEQKHMKKHKKIAILFIIAATFVLARIDILPDKLSEFIISMTFSAGLIFCVDLWIRNRHKQVKFEKTVNGFDFCEVKDILYSVLKKHDIKYERSSDEPAWKESIEIIDSQSRIEIEQGYPSDKRTKFTFIGFEDLSKFKYIFEDLTNSFNDYHKKYTFSEKLGNILETTIITGVLIFLLSIHFISRL